MEIKIIEPSNHNQYYDEILEMLTVADNEFVPPLSARISTTQADMTPDKNGGIENYFNELKKQRLVVSVENGFLLGFVSYRENYTSNDIAHSYLPNIYISTLIVSPLARGKALTRKMYDFLFDSYKHSYILTRTWSTNAAHIKILTKYYEFEILKTIPNHRGEGIDTVYFAKKPQI